MGLISSGDMPRPTQLQKPLNRNVCLQRLRQVGPTQLKLVAALNFKLLASVINWNDGGSSACTPSESSAASGNTCGLDHSQSVGTLDPQSSKKKPPVLLGDRAPAWTNRAASGDPRHPGPPVCFTEPGKTSPPQKQRNAPKRDGAHPSIHQASSP